MEDNSQSVTPDLNSSEKSSAKIPWVGLIIVIVVISFVVSAVTGYLFGNQFSEWLDQTLKSEIPGVTSTIEITEEESAAITAVEAAQPAVVSIVVTKDLSKIYEDYYGNNSFPFSFAPPTKQEGKQEIGGGTGFFISSDGMLLTNKHVVQDETAEYSVITPDGTRYDNVKVLARDPIEDMAILKVDDGNDFPTAELGDSDSLKVGQTVIAIGNSLGQYQNSVTKGIVSGLDRNIIAGDAYGQASERLQNIIQTDAAINQGNSGGPLINLAGQVVGINTAVDFSGQLVGFALPVNGLKDEIQSVQAGGEIVKPYLGVRYVLLNQQIAAANNLPYEYGALIIRGQEVIALAVIPGSPADKAGIEENDIVLEINGTKITEDNDLTASIQEYSVGETVTLKVFHDDEEKDVEIVLEERPSI
ncbi:S1C family serine protease [Patescibacteria group bacterium]